MIVSIEHRFVFLSMPKCASSAIFRALRDEGQIIAIGRPPLKHTPYSSFERFVLPYVADRVGMTRDDFTVFCLFREPIEWLHSWYSYRTRRKLRNPRHPSHKHSTSGISFNEFAAAWLTTPRPPFADVGSQAEFVVSADGSVGPDALYRYDDIDSAVDHLGQLVGRRLRLKRIKVSPRRELVVDDANREALVRALARDYEIYGGI